MRKNTTIITAAVIAFAMLMSACSGISMQVPGLNLKAPAVQASNEGQSAAPDTSAQAAAQSTKQAAAPQSGVAAQTNSMDELLAAYQDTLVNIYKAVNPAVVNIRVVQNTNSAALDLSQAPNLPENPFFNDPNNPSSPQLPQGNVPSQALGSGFVWDTAGHIITNNHVIKNADKIEVSFSDGRTVSAELVGADPDSDLAVLKVNVPAEQLTPVQVADSSGVEVGQLAIAIGNPFGLEGTMTVGIVSALGRSLPVNEGLAVGPTYSIPEIIQTDAPINPGNSGGVLLNSQGQVIGVTAAIESTVGSNAGIGFVIPSSIVQKVVPSLIDHGDYQHPWIGISATSLTPDLIKAINSAQGASIKEDQQGVMIAEVMANSPAEKAGLKGSAQTATIDGQQINIGGDIITAVDGQPVHEMDDLIAYLSSSTSVGQKINFTLLRDGKETNLELTLAARPASQDQAATQTQQGNEQTPEQQTPGQQTPNQQSPQGQAPQQTGSAYLGIAGLPMNAEIANAMNLAADQKGILVIQVAPGSAAQQAGLMVGSIPLTINGQQVMVGGDVITAIQGQPVSSVEELRSVLTQYNPGQEVTLTILRNNQSQDVKATLGTRPNQ